MQSLSTEFKKLVDTLFKKTKKRQFERNPERDWQKLVLAFVVVSLIVSIFAVYFFYKLNSGEFIKTSNENTTKTEPFNKNVLETTNSFYDAKEKHLQELKTNSNILVDPAL